MQQLPRKRRIIFGSALLLATAHPGVARAGPQAVHLDAKKWWNPPALRLPEDRTWLVVFFTTVYEGRLEPMLPWLERMSRRKDVVVAALSPEPAERVEDFVKRRRTRFAVGAGTNAHRRLRIEKWPTLIVIRPGSESVPRLDGVDLRTLERLEKQLGSAPAASEHPANVRDLPPDAPLEQLTQIAVYAEQDDIHRKEALRRLSKRMPPAEFVALCDQLLASIPDELEFLPRGARYYWEWEIRFLRARSDPNTTAKPEVRSPAEDLHRRLLRNELQMPLGLSLPGKEEIPSRPVEEWAKDYHAFLGSNLSEHLLARYVLASNLREHPDKPAVRKLILDVLPTEPDFGIRFQLVLALDQVCPLGDEEAIHLLEALAAREAQGLRYTKPSMLSVAHRLRSGEE